MPGSPRLEKAICTLAPNCCDMGSQQLTSAHSLEHCPQPTQAVSPEKAWGLLPPPGGGSGGHSQ